MKCMHLNIDGSCAETLGMGVCEFPVMCHSYEPFAEIRSCPFCGSGADVETVSDDYGNERYMTVCGICGANTGLCDSPGESISKWNSRDGEEITVLGLRLRTLNSLKRHGVHTIGHLRSLSDDELLSFDWFGPANLEDVKQCLKKFGIERC